MMTQLRSTTKKAFILPAIALTFTLASCQGQAGNDTAGGGGTATPGAAPAANTGSAGGGTISLTGAGATFPAPLYQRWFQEYNQKNPSVQVTYQPVGSGAGVEQFTQGTVDFAASDTGMKKEEIAKVARGAVLLPMTAGSIVVAYNAPGVQGLKLPRAVYSDIFLGNIKTWDDPKIAAANPGVKLPSLPIQVVHRSDGSGTTAVFTKHLSAISPAWKSKVGDGKTVQWPTGKGAKGNDGVTAEIQQTQGAIGYVEYGFAKQGNLSMASLENKAKQFVEPSAQAAAATLANVKLPADLQVSITDPEGANAYPIVTYTWVMAYQKYDDPKKAETVKSVLNWGLTEGQKFSEELGYVPLPPEVVTQVQAAANKIQ